MIIGYDEQTLWWEIHETEQRDFLFYDAVSISDHTVLNGRMVGKQ
jgi:hypothetical protein